MIHGIHHTAISTPDLERAIEFYSQLLGFEVVSRFEWGEDSDFADDVTGLEGSAARAAMLKLGNACLELFQFSAPPARPAEATRPVCDHGITHLALQVTDIDSEYERLSKAGMFFHCPPGNRVRAIYGRDPDGNVVELMEVAPSSPMFLNMPDGSAGR